MTVHHRVQATGFQPVSFSFKMQRCWGRHFWARGYFCATVGQMTEEMIKQYLEHHFEPKPNDDFRLEPQ